MICAYDSVNSEQWLHCANSKLFDGFKSYGQRLLYDSLTRLHRSLVVSYNPVLQNFSQSPVK